VLVDWVWWGWRVWCWILCEGALGIRVRIIFGYGKVVDFGEFGVFDCSLACVLCCADCLYRFVLRMGGCFDGFVGGGERCGCGVLRLFCVCVGVAMCKLVRYG